MIARVYFQWSRWPILLSMLLTVACAQSDIAAQSSPEQEIDPWVLHIDIGRSGAILSNGEKALSLLTGDAASNSYQDENADSRRQDFLERYQNVIEHKNLQAKACAKGLVRPDLCDEPYLPDWLQLPRKTSPSLENLNTWSADLRRKITPLSGDLCEQAMEMTGDPSLCAVE